MLWKTPFESAAEDIKVCRLPSKLRNKYVIITSKRRFDVIITYLSRTIYVVYASFLGCIYAMLGTPFANPGKIHSASPSDIYVENVHFDWFNQYLCAGRHFQSNLDIFQFNFMFVKSHDVPPLFCVNVENDMRFLWQQFFMTTVFFTTPTLWIRELF